MKKSTIFVIILLLVAGYFFFDLGQFFSFEFLKTSRESLQQIYQSHEGLTILVYFLLYLLVAALALPGAAVMSLAGGTIFGFTKGFVIVSFASSIGALLAFVVSRYLFRDLVERKYGNWLKDINNGLKRDGLFYLFTLRLIPVFPFFIINLGFSITPVKAWAFYWVSQLGMLPGTVLYVNAGTQLGKIESPSEILSPQIILSFAVLGIFPVIARKVIRFFRRQKKSRNFKKPSSFDYNVTVIGAGSGGLVASLIAAAVKAKVLLVERDKMGGDCLNTGCVPSKAFIHSARMLKQAERAKDWGFRSASVDFDFADVMERVQEVIETVAPHDSVERFTDLGVDVVIDDAEVVSPWEVRVGGKTITTRNIILATGAKPYIPEIPGVEEVKPLTSDSVWDLRKLPESLVVVGGGPIGSELAQAFARFGSKVTIIEAYHCVLSREDDDVSRFICHVFESEGIRVLKNHRVTRFENKGGEKIVVCQSGDKEISVKADEVFLALGRRANVSGFGLEKLNISLNDNGTIRTDPFLRTDYPNIYAVGDVAGPYQFTHFASHQAWYASVNALFSPFRKFRADYRVVPRTTFTDPQVAQVGLTEKEAVANDISYEVVKYDISELDRAIAEGENQGFVKALTVPGKDKILGAAIVGPHAGELITEFVSAMKHKYGLNHILGTIHVYPTFSEANKFSAGNWKKAHAPQWLMKWLKRFHSWRR